MTQKQVLGLMVLVLAGIGVGALWGIRKSMLPTDETTGGHKIKVAASIYPVYDIVRQVGEEYADVKLVLPAGASPHTFEATPTQVRNLTGSRALFMVGHGLDNWALGLASGVAGMEMVTVDKGITLLKYDYVSWGGIMPSARAARLSVEAEEGAIGTDEHEAGHDDHHVAGYVDSDSEHHAEHEHGEGGDDPHYWLSTKNAAQIARQVAEKLGEWDGAHKQEYEDNTQKFIADLEGKSAEWKKQTAGLENKNLIVFHGSWNYFADEFGLKVAGSFEPFPGQNPTPQYLAELKTKIHAAQVKVIYVEPQFSSEAARNLARELGVEVKTLDPLGGGAGRENYIQMMDYNIHTLTEK